MWQRAQNVQRSTRNVQKETDRIEMSASAQFLSQRHQVVIVDPKDIVLSDEGAELVGELPIDTHIARMVGTRVFLQIDSIMQDGPKDPVRQPFVIFLKIIFRQIDD